MSLQQRLCSHTSVDVTVCIVPNTDLKVKFIVMLDLTARLRVIHIKVYKALGMKGGSSADVIGGLATKWLMDKTKPQAVTPDNSVTITITSRDVGSFLNDVDIQITAPAEYKNLGPWTNKQLPELTATILQTLNLGHPPLPRNNTNGANIAPSWMANLGHT